MDNNPQLTPVGAQVSEAESLEYIVEMIMGGYYFIELAKVLKVYGEAPNLVVDVLPLVSKLDKTGAVIGSAPVYSVPVWRLQRGSSAVIMDPVVGDIGLIAVCDRDTTIARANRKVSGPGSSRRHSKTDAIYLGGVLNTPPSQYIEFADGALNIVSPNPINVTTESEATVTCTKATVTAPKGMVCDTPLFEVTGDIVDNSSSQSSTLKNLREKYNSHTHQVSGVEAGGDAVTSNETESKT